MPGMSTQVTLRLPDELYDKARHWAAITHRDIAETLADALALALTLVYTTPRLEKGVSSLSDGEVLALYKVQLKPAQGHRLSELLERQREASLAEGERQELMALMQIYQQLWVRQSEALAEAVRRGLQPPLES